jgi:UDP-2,4-diacetamido-2,4,6-trideoxy-beta-L-altropyranose hydrolase
VNIETPRLPGALILRCDANVVMGTGHAMRCLALGQAWQDLCGSVIFAMSTSTPAIEERISKEKMEVVYIGSGTGTLQDAEELARVANSHSSRWVAVDGYEFGVSYQQAIKNVGMKSLLISDATTPTDCVADLILNQNAYAREEFYTHRNADSRLLLGVRFAMLRREFSAWKDWKRELTPRGSKVLLTMGGSDPGNMTLEVIEALGSVKENLDVAVVIGGSNPHVRSLETAASKFPGTLRLLTDISLPDWMAWADLAISGAGTTSAEICMMGLPAILIDIASNQTPVANELSRVGAAVHKTIADVQHRERFANCVRDILVSAEFRRSLSHTARSLVDGRGAQRVLAFIQGSELKLRPAEKRDCKILWEWANDPVVRAASFCQDFIPWEQHVNWFHSRLGDQKSRIMLAMTSDQTEIGTVRFRIEGDRAVVSISLDRGARGKGHGLAVLNEAVKELFRSSNIAMIDAYVKPENETSQKLFGNAGFQRSPGTKVVEGQQAIHFVLCKNGAS